MPTMTISTSPPTDLSRNAVRTPASTEDNCPPPPPPPPIYRDPGEQDTESDMMTPRSVKTASILSGIASSNHADSRDDLHRKVNVVISFPTSIFYWRRLVITYLCIMRIYICRIYICRIYICRIYTFSITANLRYQ